MARLLVVDDDEDFLEMLVADLQSRGHTVVSCVDPERAPEIALGFKPELAVLDYVMPRLMGTDLMAKLRRDRPELAVIFLSGMESKRYAHKIPADDRVRFFVKPVDFKKLDAEISRLLDPKRALKRA